MRTNSQLKNFYFDHCTFIIHRGEQNMLNQVWEIDIESRVHRNKNFSNCSETFSLKNIFKNGFWANQKVQASAFVIPRVGHSRTLTPGSIYSALSSKYTVKNIREIWQNFSNFLKKSSKFTKIWQIWLIWIIFLQCMSCIYDVVWSNNKYKVCVYSHHRYIEEKIHCYCISGKKPRYIEVYRYKIIVISPVI